MTFLLHHLLEASAARTPDASAVVDRDRTISYAELDSRASALAAVLQSEGVRNGDRVGIYLDKSLEAIIAIYAILKAGACYVPLDPQSPVKRLSFICRNCVLRCLVSSSEKSTSWSAMLKEEAPLEVIVVIAGTRVSALETSGLSARVVDATTTPAVTKDRRYPATIDLDLAYILYTSGSTGDPKGVMLSHLNALAFVRWGLERFAVTAGDRLSSHAPLHFDLSIFDIFVSAAAGATLVLVPPAAGVLPAEVARFIDGNAITVWYSVPSILSLLTLRAGLRPGSLPSLRAVLFAGEVFPTKYLLQLMAFLPHAEFHNLYGPTETNVCTHYQVPAHLEDKVEPISIGSAIADVETFVLGEDGRRVEPGEVGELCVRGTTVMCGYWGDPEKTRRSLVPYPFGPPFDPVYRTGDVVQENERGEYRFLGRRDAQIKSRGYRIELGDIEATVYAHPDVLECAVVAVPDAVVTNRIRAFVSVRPQLTRAELVRYCQDRLPKYMIPESFELRDGLPKTSTGKVDRQALMNSIKEGGQT